ncbi:MAG: PQQ-binding-like beta-propeller repeat protein [Candidatus Brocadiae bacterium]|nr:PQQ-binding-like beta-propeller repeat protein [Candidatus Brocadiia bacterium]
MTLLALAPGLFAPLQSLLSFLPQIAIAGLALLTAVFRPQVYRWAWSKAKARPGIAVAVAGVTLLSLVGAAFALRRGKPEAPPPPDAKVEGSWTFRGDRMRTGGDGSSVPLDIAVSWQFVEMLDRRPFASSPAVWGQRVYVGCDNDVLYCFHATEPGDPLWTFAARHPVFATPTVTGGRVYIGEGLHHHADARLYCLDAMSGKKIWEFVTTSHVEDAPTVVDGRVYFGAGDDGVYCLSAATGEKIWQARGMHIDTSPLVAGGLVLVGAGYGETGVAAYRASDGTRAWFTPLPASCWGPPSLGPAGAVVGIGNGNFVHTNADPRAEILCLSLEGGGIVWRTPLRDAVLAAAAISGDRVYLGDRSGDFSCFDAKTGRRIWKTGCGSGVVASAALAPNAVVYGCLGGHLHAVAPADGKPIWTWDASRDAWTTANGFTSSPTIADGRIYAGCDNFVFYCLGRKKP